MLELLAYLRANGFKTFIVSGGGVEFMRVWTEQVYGIPPEQVVGSTHRHRSIELQDGEPVLMRRARDDFIDDGAGKPVGINRFIGRRPIAAFGNSDGDLQMLQWTAGADGRRLDDAGASTTMPSASTPTGREWPAGHQGRHVLPGADGRGEGERLGRDQHEGRLEDDLPG